MRRKILTTSPARPGDCSGQQPEFIRVPDVQRLSGIKRGLTYRKIADGTFKSVLLREPGNVQGVRLIYWPSVREYLLKLMAQQEAAPAKPAQAKTDLPEAA
jgi:predicted DNA-binding transcriptional regulator AlpA